MPNGMEPTIGALQALTAMRMLSGSSVMFQQPMTGSQAFGLSRRGKLPR